MSQDVKEHLNQLAEKKEPGQCQIRAPRCIIRAA